MPSTVLNEKAVEELYLSHSTSVECRKNNITVSNAQTVDIESEENGLKRKSLPEMIPAFGILMAILSVVCFSTGSVIAKILTEMHSIEVLIFRCSFQFIFYLTSILIYKHPFFGVPGHRFHLASRAIFGSISAICIYTAYRLIPLADAFTIHFSSPVFVVILAYFILKEPLSLLQILTGIVTLIGVVIIAKPEFLFGSNSEINSESRLEGTILAVLAAFTTAMVLVYLRKLNTTPIAVVIMWFSITSVISSLVILLLMDRFVWPTGYRTWSLLIAVGICGICDQYFMTLALHYESAGPISVTRTLSIVLAFIWDVLLLSQSFNWTSIVGACLISGCILLLAVSKWKDENPELFKRLKDKFYCCTQSTQSDDKVYLRKSSEPFYDSIDSRFCPNDNQRNGRLKLDDRKF